MDNVDSACEPKGEGKDGISIEAINSRLETETPIFWQKKYIQSTRIVIQSRLSQGGEINVLNKNFTGRY